MDDFQPWPNEEKEELKFDKINLKLISETNLSSCIQRELSIESVPTKRKVLLKQLQLCLWPAGGTVPCDYQSLLDSIEIVSSRMKCLREANNVMVHCKDGASRCGVFLALLFICTNIDTTGEVDIYHAVNQIKQRRPEFVKNKVQYDFLFEFVAEYINVSDT
jgi:protein tyrosine phosphatase